MKCSRPFNTVIYSEILLGKLGNTCYTTVADLGGGGALGASAPPAESMEKNILTYLFSSRYTVGTFLRVL